MSTELVAVRCRQRVVWRRATRHPGQSRQPALEPLRQYIQDNTRWQYGRWNAGTAVEQVAQQHPELRDQAIQILSDVLAHAIDNDPETNGFFLADLLHLNAVEALPIIRSAFEQDMIDDRSPAIGARCSKSSDKRSIRTTQCSCERMPRRNAKKAEMRRPAAGVHTRLALGQPSIRRQNRILFAAQKQAQSILRRA